MGIRQTINENPAATAAVTGGIVVLAILFIIWQACSGSGGGGVTTTKAFFTVDDGKTWFPDENTNIPPFQTKDGKTAVRAMIYTCDGKTQFCGYLEMYSPQDKAMLEAAKNAGGKGTPATGGGPMGYPGQPMVKRPFAPPNTWVPLSPPTMPMYQQVIQVKCPDGSTEKLARVFPE